MRARLLIIFPIHRTRQTMIVLDDTFKYRYTHDYRCLIRFNVTFGLFAAIPNVNARKAEHRWNANHLHFTIATVLLRFIDDPSTDFSSHLLLDNDNRSLLRVFSLNTHSFCSPYYFFFLNSIKFRIRFFLPFFLFWRFFSPIDYIAISIFARNRYGQRSKNYQIMRDNFETRW